MSRTFISCMSEIQFTCEKWSCLNDLLISVKKLSNEPYNSCFCLFCFSTPSSLRVLWRHSLIPSWGRQRSPTFSPCRCVVLDSLFLEVVPTEVVLWVSVNRRGKMYLCSSLSLFSLAILLLPNLVFKYIFVF